MLKNEEEWFRRAYEIAKKSSFCYTHTEVPENLAKRFGLDYESLKRSWSEIPSKEAFLEEKQNVLARLTPALKNLFPDSSGFYWGKDRGDIDLAVISPTYTSVPEHIRNEFPLVDWCGLEYFTVPSPRMFLHQLMRAEKLYSDSKYLSEEQKKNIFDIVNSARQMWGETDLRSAWNTLDFSLTPNICRGPLPSNLFYKQPALR